MVVPTTPISKPWAMKMLRICSRLAPMDMQQSDVTILFHNHHDQRDQDVQSANQLDQADGDSGDDLLHIERAQDLAELLHPGVGGKFRTCDLLGRFGHLGSLVDIVKLEVDGADQIADGEESLC